MITRNNYEEYFLLYGDNELSPSERLAVERFIEAHPDLREEWELLLQCKITPDDHLVFGEKDTLRQSLTAAALIHPGNHEEYFISYIDGELDGTARTQVEEYLRLHPALRTEFMLLQQATFTPDPSLVYPDKEELYRKEKERRIALLPWGRIAAAAITVGAIVLLIFKNGQGTHSTGAVASGKKENSAVTSRTPDTLYYTGTSPDSRSPGSSVQSGGRALTGAHNQTGDSSLTGTHELNGRKLLAGSNSQTGVQSGKGTRNSPAGKKIQADDPLLAGGKSPQHDPSLPNNGGLPDNRAVAQTNIVTGQDEPVKKYSDPSVSRLAALDPATAQRPGKILLPPDGILTGGVPSAGNKNTDFATQALLAADMEETDEGSMSEPLPSQKKSKLRGFFRKVSRVLEKTTSRDEDDKHNVLIGGFQFALK